MGHQLNYYQQLFNQRVTQLFKPVSNTVYQIEVSYYPLFDCYNIAFTTNNLKKPAISTIIVIQLQHARPKDFQKLLKMIQAEWHFQIKIMTPLPKINDKKDRWRKILPSLSKRL